MIANRIVKGGFKTIPYNEVFVRVGGPGRIVNGIDCCTGEIMDDKNGTGRSFEVGLGLPIALFVRTATFGHLISLLRTRARLVHVIGENHLSDIPLLLITPELGVRVLTEPLQYELLKIASKQLNPFQNPSIAHRIRIHHDDGGNVDEEAQMVDGSSNGGPSVNKNKDDSVEFEQKLEELIDLDENVRKILTPKECARLAGGFGVTDDSIAMILKDAMLSDKEVLKKRNEKRNNQQKVEGQEEEKSTTKDMDGHYPQQGDEDEDDPNDGNKLQDIVNEGLAYAVRSGDYYTSRQLLILYTLVASMGNEDDDDDDDDDDDVHSDYDDDDDNEKDDQEKEKLEGEIMIRKQKNSLGGGDIKELQSLAGNTTTTTTTTRRRSRRTTGTSTSKTISTGKEENDDNNNNNNTAITKTTKSKTALKAMKNLPAPPPPPPLDTDRLRSATNCDGLLAVLGAAQVLKAMQNGSAKKRTEESVLALDEYVPFFDFVLVNFFDFFCLFLVMEKRRIIFVLFPPFWFPFAKFFFLLFHAFL